MRVRTLLLFIATCNIVFAQPPNDQCSAVIPVALSVGSTHTLSGTRTGATTTNDGVPGSVLMTTAGVATVWEAFTTTTCSNVTALFCGTALPATTMWNFITPDCPSDSAIYFSYANFGILCPNGQFGIQWFNLAPGTYYLPIYCTGAGGAYTLDLSAVACIPGPANDECAGAVPLIVNTSCVTTSSSVENGTLSFAAATCNGSLGNANDDVWFSFVATGTDHTVTVNGTGGDVDAVVDLFEGTCAGLNAIACADATFDGEIETLNATGLVVGNTYYVRVFHWYTALAIDPEFTICITGAIATAVSEVTGAALSTFPNPTEGTITVSGTENARSAVVYDALGRFTTQQPVTAAMTTLDLSALPRGIYTVEVITRDGMLRRTTVIKN